MLPLGVLTGCRTYDASALSPLAPLRPTLAGVYALRTRDLPALLSKAVGTEKYARPQPADVCAWHAGLRGVTAVCLSADQAVLAAVQGGEGRVSFFPLAAMTGPGSGAHWSLELGSVQSFAWSKSGALPQAFLAVTADRALVLGRYGDASAAVVVAPSGVYAADWCPSDAPVFGYSTGRRLALVSVAADLSVCEVAGLPLEHPGEAGAVFESVSWVLPDALVLGATPVEEGGDAEGTDELCCLLQLQGWSAGSGVAPSGAELLTAPPGFVEDGCTPCLSGPYLHAVCLPSWGAIVRAHRKASDDHVQLLRVREGVFGSGGAAQAVAITEDKLGIRLPNGRDGDNNYVLGLALDTTVPLDPIPNPLNAEKPPLTPPPVLLVATSDGVLRVYGFGHEELSSPVRPGPDSVVPVPAAPPAWASSSGAAAVGGPGSAADQTEAAARAALPDDDEDDVSGHPLCFHALLWRLVSYHN